VYFYLFYIALLNKFKQIILVICHINSYIINFTLFIKSFRGYLKIIIFTEFFIEVTFGMFVESDNTLVVRKSFQGYFSYFRRGVDNF
jgi:hypothetical protein